jgi:hypothetical protein
MKFPAHTQTEQDAGGRRATFEGLLLAQLTSRSQKHKGLEGRARRNRRQG